ncbi:TspO/MBR family protein [Microbacterium sp. DT81.1]|uniref:TspO/MBR family protein n=1 Tax=Microbacterium sp. DT81.1 TaxID=3393413 RepID=UPI003CF2C6D3
MAETQRRDIFRQSSVIAAASFMVIAAFIGTGAAGGTPVQDLQGGALDADGSFLAPGRPAFGIWTVIYAGLLAYTVWQALPGQRASARQRSMGWWIALTMVLNGGWLVASQFGPLVSTVVAIVALLAALGWTFHRAVVTKEHQSPWPDSLLVDGVTGLHLGWVSVATVANIAAWLTAVGPASWGAQAHLWGVVVLVLVLVIGLAISWASGWRLAPPFAMAWGCLWIGLERLGGQPYAPDVGSTALIVAGLLVLVPSTARVVTLLRQGGD